MGTSLVAGEAVAGHGRVAGRRGRRERPERVVASLRAGHESAGGRAESRDIAQVVGVGVVERSGCRATFVCTATICPASR